MFLINIVTIRYHRLLPRRQEGYVGVVGFQDVEKQ
jgi:hypothetical protein